MEDLLWSIVPFDTKKECSFLIVYITNITLIIAKSMPSMVRPPNYSLLLIIFKLGFGIELILTKATVFVYSSFLGVLSLLFFYCAYN